MTIVKHGTTVAAVGNPAVLMRDTDMKLIHRLPLFADIDDTNFGALVRGAYLQSFPPRLDLIREGELPDFLHIVVEGSVELYGRLDERETALAILPENATFVLAAVVRDEVYLTSARTLVPTRILMIPAVGVRNIFDQDAAFARAVVRELASRYRDLVRDLKGQKLRTSVERLANYLLRQAPKRGSNVSFVLPLEKRTLASYLGMAPEHLSRALAQLAAHGIGVNGQTVTITDRARLQSLAMPHPLLDES